MPACMQPLQHREDMSGYRDRKQGAGEGRERQAMQQKVPRLFYRDSVQCRRTTLLLEKSSRTSSTRNRGAKRVCYAIGEEIDETGEAVAMCKSQRRMSLLCVLKRGWTRSNYIVESI